MSRPRCHLCGCVLRMGKVDFCDIRCKNEYERLNPPKKKSIIITPTKRDRQK